MALGPETFLREAKRIDLLRQSLGIALECCVRELFRRIDRRVELQGEEFFPGTAEAMELGPFESVGGGGEVDLVAREVGREGACGEVKPRKVSKQEVMRFAERAERVVGERVLVVIASDAEPLALPRW